MAILLTFAAVAPAAMIGYGPGIGSGLDSSGSRLNVDELFTTLPAGRYQVTQFAVNAGSTSGNVTPFLSRLTGADTYQTLWVGPAFTPTGTGAQADAYSAGGQYIRLWTATAVYAGFVQSNAVVRYTDDQVVAPGNTDHDSSFTTPTGAGQTVGGFSNANLPRNYGFGITVAPVVNGGDQIYMERFGGSGANNLSGKAPDVRPGQETWVAGSAIKQDGSKSTGGTNSAWLPFVPQAGTVYSLSLDVNPDISTSSDWFAVGFSQGNATGSFHDGGNNAAAWILNRMDDASASAFQTFMGPVTASGASHNPDPDKVGWINLEVLLDTRAANWTVTWLADGDVLRGPVAYGTNPTINYVGFAGYGNTTGMFDNFVLQTVPEPMTLTLLTLTGAALGGYVRRRRS